MTEKKKIPITGGAGFIGVNSADAFVRDGWSVCVLDNLSRKGAQFSLHVFLLIQIMTKILTTISAESGTQRAKLKELWQYRELAWNMTLRDIKVRYKQTVLGVAWAVLQPLVTMMIFTFIFGGLAQIPSDGFPYPVFVYSGLLIWNLFATSVTTAGGSMVAASNMIAKVYFPRLIVPIAAMGVAVIDFLVSFFVLLLLMLAFGVLPSTQLLLFPIFVIGILFSAIGVGTWLAALTVSYRDFRFVVPFMIQTWMYITPVIYPANFIPEAYRWLVHLNPVFGWVSGSKAAILGTSIDWVAVAFSFGWTVALLWIGVSYFNRAERRFANIIQRMSEFSIQAKNLGKQYLIGGAEQRHDSFREMVTSAISSPFKKFKKLSGTDDSQDRFWALKDLNFEVQQGEKVGIIGHNGAGKSTLLKVLSRITPPTAGELKIRGRVSSLLEVGTGFHPELTGRENIFLNGSILGMSQDQIRTRFDEIVAFAEIEKFIDTPVKRYSSGMYVRLAFSVAAHLDSDVLIVDEVLAVGDQRFQDRSLGKLDEMGQSGRTVLFVSHNLSMISRLCAKTMLLEKGQLLSFGPTNETVRDYSKRRNEVAGSKARGFFGPMTDLVEVESVVIEGHEQDTQIVIDPLMVFRVMVTLETKADFDGSKATLTLVRNGVDLISQHDTHINVPLARGRYEYVFTIPEKYLSPASYSLKFAIVDAATGNWQLATGNWQMDVGRTSS